jgi:branched-chain amino acid aminotransferase
MVIGMCEAARIPLRLGDFTLLDVYAADEAFVTGTFGGVTPVRAVDGRALPGSLPGPVTARLRALYAELTGQA